VSAECRVHLDPEDPRSIGFAHIFDGLSKQHLPVYIEVDPETSTISRLLIPWITRVIGIQLIDTGVLGIELEPSQDRHVLRQSAAEFDELEKQLREALSSGAPVILTEDDAHEMYRLMNNLGLKVKKVWIQGNLHVSTANNPGCNVWWGWHVAPTLCVRGPCFFQTRLMVIDPSLFTTPVSKATRKSVQGDANAVLTDSDGSIFYLWGNITDPTFVQTNQILATYRLQLLNRAIQFGPPPYACPISRFA